MSKILSSYIRQWSQLVIIAVCNWNVRQTFTWYYIIQLYSWHEFGTFKQSLQSVTWPTRLRLSLLNRNFFYNLNYASLCWLLVLYGIIEICTENFQSHVRNVLLSRAFRWTSKSWLLLYIFVIMPLSHAAGNLGCQPIYDILNSYILLMFLFNGGTFGPSLAIESIGMFRVAYCPRITLGDLVSLT